jgi:hypothetical protein
LILEQEKKKISAIEKSSIFCILKIVVLIISMQTYKNISKKQKSQQVLPRWLF